MLWLRMMRIGAQFATDLVMHRFAKHWLGLMVRNWITIMYEAEKYENMWSLAMTCLVWSLVPVIQHQRIGILRNLDDMKSWNYHVTSWRLILDKHGATNDLNMWFHGGVTRRHLSAVLHSLTFQKRPSVSLAFLARSCQVPIGEYVNVVGDVHGPLARRVGGRHGCQHG